MALADLDRPRNRAVRKKRYRGLSVHAAEVGGRFNARQAWHYETSALAHLRPLAIPARVFHPSISSNHAEPQSSRIANPYMSAMASTPDGGLLATMSNDARVELHQPPDPSRPLPTATGLDSVAPNADSLRLSLNPADSAVRGADMCWHPRRDTLILGLSNRSALWSFDVETCREDVPSKELALRGCVGSSGVTDLSALPDKCAIAAATDDGHVFIADPRSRKHSPAFRAPSKNNAIGGVEPLLLVCGGGSIRVFDIRALPANGALGSMPVLTTLRLEKALWENGLKYASAGASFSYVEPLNSGARAVFQTETGMLGLANFITGKVDFFPEPPALEPEEAIPESGLYELGAQERHARAYPWYIERRRGVVVGSLSGGGGRVLTPCVGRPAFRVVPLDLGKADNDALFNSSRLVHPLQRDCEKTTTPGVVIDTPHHVSCLSADEQLRRVVLGYPGNLVDVFHTEMEFRKGTKAQM